MASEMMAKGYKVVSGGTDNHLILVNLKASKNIDGARVEKICDKVMITLNKNSVPGDKSALNPGGNFFQYFDRFNFLFFSREIDYW